MEKEYLKEALITEGHYDARRLEEVFNAPIVQTNGFQIFKDKKLQQLIKEFASTVGIIIITDNDAAGFKIRNFIVNICSGDEFVVKHAYIPKIEGKEKRKYHHSAEGLIGVEGIKNDVIRQEVLEVSAEVAGQHTPYDSMLFFDLGLCGAQDSAKKRRALLQTLGLPTRLSNKAMQKLLPRMLTAQQLALLVESL